MKKILAILLSLTLVLSLGTVAFADGPSPENPVTVRIGLTGAVYEPIWDVVKEKLAPEGIILEYVQKYYRQYAFPGCKDAVFALATLGNDAGMYGAAKLVI